MQQDIKLLSPDLINKIAAGEVIERPASIVKELLENSIDSGANEITLEVEKGGIQLIKVSDNGSGMNETNAKLAFIQHATSKITKPSDLDAIFTLGFRGEALASIASISRAEIHTKTSSSDPVKVSAINSKIELEPGQARSQGTTVIIRKIFDNIPARKKFLRSESTEFKYILDVFTAIALAHPTISFKLIKNGKQQLQLDKTQEQKTRIMQINTKYTEKDLIPITYDSPEIKINGFITHPNLSFNNNPSQFVFINTRSVSDRLITKAIREGYSTTIPKGNQPSFYIFIKIDTKEVDVNVHPRKLEVRFTSPGKIFAALKKSISQSLENHLKKELELKFNRDELQIDREPLTDNYIKAAPSKISTTRSRQPSNNSVKDSLDFTKILLSTKSTPVQDSFDLAESTQLFEFDDYLQLFNTYILIGRENKLLIIDQHAADERIKFEQITDKLSNEEDLETQALLIPDELDLSDEQELLVKNNFTTIKKLGFDISELSKNSMQLNTIPVLLKDKNYLDTLYEVINELNSDLKSGLKINDIASFEKVIATMACHGSIRAGMQLNKNIVSKLITELFSCKLPYACPHGRPIIWEISRTEIEKNFKRKL